MKCEHCKSETPCSAYNFGVPCKYEIKNKVGGQLKYGEKTIMISFRCPESKVNEIKTLVKQKLISYESTK